MNNMKLLVGATSILLASAFTVIETVDWKVKDDYKVQFCNGKIPNPANEYGNFKGLKATILFDESNPENSKIKASIVASTVDIGGYEKITAHAKEPNVLDVDKFPVITFVSTVITKSGTGFNAIGNLTMKGITKEIKFPFTFEKETFIGGFTIATEDFNITRGNAWKDVYILLTIPVTK
ncbi:MAG: YceI family protein [Bacteroidia bacterium]